MDIFISYSTLDKEHAQNLELKLKARNKSCFLAAKDISSGESFKETIRNELLAAKEVFVLITPRSLNSEWVITEWGAAWALGKRIVPILLQCGPESLPSRLADLHAIDFHQIDRIINEFEERQRNKQASPIPPIPRIKQPHILLFDIDGTVLNPLDNLQDRIGLQFVQLLHELADRGCYFVFITGNDFELQQRRIITPIKEQGLGSSVFCFSDGGSRAFEFNVNSKNFEEIREYSEGNLMNQDQVDTITRIFKNALEDFLVRPGNETLLGPDNIWHARTLDYLDIIISPLRPSFIKSPKFEQFCKEVQELFNHPNIESASFELLRTFPGALVIRAHGKNPEFDVSRLQNLISNRLLLRKEYRELSMPEVEIRGGRVVCQIALKPFNDEDKRNEFRKIIDQELRAHGADQFSVLLGGRTTIDIQIKGVNKKKAIQFLRQYKDLDPQKMIYFGNEFGQHGNDRAVLDMQASERPGLIINVGHSLNENDLLRERLIEDRNGPLGTVNYLKFLLHEAR